MAPTSQDWIREDGGASRKEPRPIAYSETGQQAPRLRCTVFQRDGKAVLRMMLPDGRETEATFPNTKRAMASMLTVYLRLMGEAS